MGVLVLGMHRSGTSAVTAAVAALGVPLGDPDDQFPARGENPEGFHESARLSAFDELLLERLGGRWDAPPVLGRGWEATPDMVPHVAIARDLFSMLHAGDRWVWKDPRLCLLLGFWRKVLGDHRAILVTRDPLAVARSLRTRDGLSKTYGLALWERYTRCALGALAGRPVLVVDYTALMDDAAHLGRWAHELAAFLGEERAGDTSDPQRAVVQSMHDSLRRNRSSWAAIENDQEVSSSQRELASTVLALTGRHDELRLPALPPETPSTAVRIAEHRQCTVEACTHQMVRVEVPWRPARSPLHLLRQRSAPSARQWVEGLEGMPGGARPPGHAVPAST